MMVSKCNVLKRLKVNDINQLTVATDPHFNFEGALKLMVKI